MLPHALKVAWFCLSISGAVACWVVLLSFSRAINCYWMFICYCIFVTLLEGVFSMGMIYDMDPFQMPRAFCLAQVTVIYYSALSLTGTCTAFTWATAGSVLWPSLKANTDASTVAWKNVYYLPVVVFPLTCMSIALPILIWMDAIQPSEDLHCDVSHPEWGRFLGYAGFPMILTIPCFVISAAAARRIAQTHLKTHRARSSFRSVTSYLHLGLKQRHERKVTWERVTAIPPPDAKPPVSFGPEKLQPMPPTCAAGDGRCASPYITPDVSASTSAGATPPPKRVEAWEVMSVIEEEGDVSDSSRQTDMMISSTTLDVPPSRPNLAPAIWRMTLFQMAFFSAQFLAALSTIIDVAQHRPTPTPFGSQHVALVLAAWGPVIVFGHLPAVRRHYMFWKR